MTQIEQTIGITGAAGQFGRLAADALLQIVPPARTALISRTPATLDRFAAQGAHVRFGDFDQPESLACAFEGIGALLVISTGALGRRTDQHAAAIEAARKAGVKRVVYTSFIAADAGNPALIARDHAATEAMLRAAGPDWTILRNAQYADAILDVILPQAFAAGTWRSASGEGRIAVISRAECAECAAAALLRDDLAGAVCAITGPELLRYRDMAMLAAAAFRKPLEYAPVDDAGLYAMFDALGVPRAPEELDANEAAPWCSDDMVSFEAALRTGRLEILSGAAADLLGRPPRRFQTLLQDRVGDIAWT